MISVLPLIVEKYLSKSNTQYFERFLFLAITLVAQEFKNDCKNKYFQKG